jgi:hypothetical protein
VVRRFRPQVVQKFVSPNLRPRMDSGEIAFRYTVAVPIQEVQPRNLAKATPADLRRLEEMFTRHFCGFTSLPASPGFGLRNPEDPEEAPEMNINVFYVVYSAPSRDADDYFRALQQELQEALEEGVILIEKQQVSLL